MSTYFTKTAGATSLRRAAALLVTIFFVAAGWSAVGANETPKRSKFDDALAEMVTRGAGDPVRVIVKAAAGRREPVKEKLAKQATRVIADHALIDAFTLEIPARMLSDLAGDPEVEHVSLDAPVRAFQTLTSALPTSGENMLLPTLGLPDSTATGAGVGVAVLDSGMIDSSDVPVEVFHDFLNGGLVATKPVDPFGHGTHVAGIIADKASTNSRYRSIGSGVRLIGLRVLEADGSGYTSTVLQALEFAVQNRVKLRIDVLNLSLGHAILEPAATDPLVQAVERAVQAGLVVVVAAGNNGTNPQTGEVGYAGITSPANAPSAITVGAVDTRNTLTRSDDAVAPFSSRGPTWYDARAKPDLVAPGRRIVSAMGATSRLYLTYPHLTSFDLKKGRGYMMLSGTSMSAGVTSGVVAAMIQASRATNDAKVALPPNAIKAILQYTAMAAPGVDYLTQGAGALNAAGAIALAKSIDPTRPENAAWLTRTVTPSTLLSNGERLPWAQHVLWGEKVLWGDPVYLNESAWAKAIVWGNTVNWNTAVVSGSAIVWGNTIVWGNAIVWGNTVLGVSADGSVTYGTGADWGTVSADAIVWGNLGGLETVASGLTVTY